MSNWKAPGHDEMKVFILIYIKKLHRKVVSQLNETIEGDEISSWMTYGRTVLCQNDAAKAKAVDNYTLVTYFPLMWKLKTVIVSKKM